MPEFLLQADGVSLAYGGNRILDNAVFNLRPGERAALVGPNGSGKTTILNLIAGRLQPDVGAIHLADGLKFAYLTQVFDFPKDATVGSLLAEKPAQVTNLEAEIAAIEARLADPKFYEEPGYEEVLTRYGTLQAEVQKMSAKTDAGAALSILGDLGMGDVSLERPMTDLSGGQKTRVLLARGLANHKDVDLLMLDEPSNHLDIETVEWLEEFLTTTYDGALLLVAHDRYLMDNLADKILEVAGHKVYEWRGNFSEYEDQRRAYEAALQARKRREYKEMQRQLAIIEELKRRNRFDAQVKSKATRLEKRREALAERASLRAKSFNLRLTSTGKSSNDVLEVEGLRKAFTGEDGDDVVLFDGADLTITKGEKVGVIGPNGTGKTTLLRLIAGLEKPDAGAVDVAPGVRLGYFDQEHAGLDPSRTLIEEIRSVRPEKRMPDEEARGILGRFLFRGDDAFKVTAKLSGGEKARLALAKFLVGATNLLVLDEPTNHLDLEGQAVVTQALQDYDGSLIVVSHDRAFLDAVVNRIAVVHAGRIGVFPGNFSDPRTQAAMREFLGVQAKAYQVRKTFHDHAADKRYGVGEKVTITGQETQTTKRLLRLAIARGWLEPLDG